jgi:hypothetical protein
MLPQSKFLWSYTKDYVPIDFPWRMLAVLTFLAAFLAAYIGSKMKGKLGLIIYISILCLALYANRNHIRVNLYTDVPLWLYIASEKTTNQHNEYLPKWVKSDLIRQDKKNFTTIDDKIKISEQSVNKLVFTYEIDQDTQVQINTIYFPDMEVILDNAKIPFSYDKTGFLEVTLTAGTHRVNVLYKEPLIAKIGNGLSLLGISFIGYLIYKFTRTKK